MTTAAAAWGCTLQYYFIRKVGGHDVVCLQELTVMYGLDSHADSEIVMVDRTFWDDSFEQDRSWDDHFKDLGYSR